MNAIIENYIIHFTGEMKMYCKKFDLEISKNDIICNKCFYKKANGFCKYMVETKE